MKSIKEIVLQSNIDCKKIKRIPYHNYNIDVALQQILEIGQFLNPKFIIDVMNKEYFIELIQWIEGDLKCKYDINKGLLISGNTGSGKTMSIDIMNIYRQMEGDNGIVYLADRKFCQMNLERINALQMTNEAVMNDFTKYYKCLTKRTIFLDDIGKELKFINYYNNVIQLVDYIIDSRSLMSGIMIGTTNLTENQLLERYGDRTFRRMMDLMSFVKLIGKDRSKP